VKKIRLHIIILFFTAKVFAQETTAQKNRLTEMVTEVYHVLKTDKQTRQGLYDAFYNRKIPIAMGTYTDNKKAGIWRFYDTRGILIQIFDYDKNKLLYEEPVDSISRMFIRYKFDTKFSADDRVTKPIILGGRVFGFVPYLELYQLSSDLDDIDPRSFDCMLEILVSLLGRLADIKIHIRTGDFTRITTFSPDLINEGDKLFIPATLNGEPIMSRIFLPCRVTYNGGLDVD
jgi:hypothetical protein